MISLPPPSWAPQAPPRPASATQARLLLPPVPDLAQAVAPPGRPFPPLPRKMHIKCHLRWDSCLDCPGRQEFPPLGPFKLCVLFRYGPITQCYPFFFWYLALQLD